MGPRNRADWAARGLGQDDRPRGLRLDRARDRQAAPPRSCMRPFVAYDPFRWRTATPPGRSPGGASRSARSRRCWPRAVRRLAARAAHREDQDLIDAPARPLQPDAILIQRRPRRRLRRAGAGPPREGGGLRGAALDLFETSASAGGRGVAAARPGATPHTRRVERESKVRASAPSPRKRPPRADGGADRMPVLTISEASASSPPRSSGASHRAVNAAHVARASSRPRPTG